MLTMLTPPGISGACLQPTANRVTRYLRGRASHALVRAVKAGVVTRDQVRSALARDEAGVRELFLAHSPAMVCPRLPSDALEIVADQVKKNLGNKAMLQIQQMVKQCLSEGDLSITDIQGATQWQRLERGVRLLRLGLSRRMERLIGDLPLGTFDYTPFSVMPTVMTLVGEEVDKAMMGEVRVMLNETPFIFIAHKEDEAAILFRKAREILQLLPKPLIQVLKFGEVVEVLSPQTNELILDILPHYQSGAPNGYPEFVLETLRENLGCEDGIEAWIKEHMALWAALEKLDKGGGDEACLSEGGRALLERLQALKTWVERHPIADLEFHVRLSEDGDYPAIYPLTDSMEDCLEMELSWYGSEGVAEQYVTCNPEKSALPLDTFDEVVRAIAIQTAIVRILL